MTGTIPVEKSRILSRSYEQKWGATLLHDMPELATWMKSGFAKTCQCAEPTTDYSRQPVRDHQR